MCIKRICDFEPPEFVCLFVYCNARVRGHSNVLSFSINKFDLNLETLSSYFLYRQCIYHINVSDESLMH